MKFLFLALLLPLFSAGQTIHFDDDKITYKGTVSVPDLSATAIKAQLQSALFAAADESKAKLETPSAGSTTQVNGSMRLKSPFHIRRTLQFILNISATDGGYTYQIDSVSVTDSRRGGSTNVKKSKELLEGIEETGAVAIDTERLLNEIDLRLQKLLTLLENNIKNKRQ